MSYKKLNNTIGWLVFIIATATYLLTMEQTTSLWDCGEYITTANKLEVGHPPGAPFFMMLGRLFSAFASPENAAMMVNAMSALSSSFSILFLFWTITMLARKFALKSGGVDKSKTIAILGSGAIGALAYTFTDSFWFSAVEGEVYAMSSLFTAIVFWAILKWDIEVDEHEKALSTNTTFLGHPNRWILFISYMIGLSIGVHLLNLLAIPAIAFVVYFKKYKFSWPSFIVTGILSLVILATIQGVIIPKTVSIADGFERFFKGFGLPFNFGSLIFMLLVIGLIVLGLNVSAKKEKPIWNTIIVSFALLLIGYSSFVMIVIRSNANPPLDENNPETLSQLYSYLKRDQYGSWPILHGQYWNSPVESSCDDAFVKTKNSSYMKTFSISSNSSFLEIEAKDSLRVKRLLSPINLHATVSRNKNKKARVTLRETELSFMNMWDLNQFREQLSDVNASLKENGFKPFVNFSEEVNEGYINIHEGKKGDRKFQKEYTTFFPRMYRNGEGQKYMAWCNYEVDPATGIYVYGGDEAKPLPLGQEMDRPTYYERLKQYEAYDEAKSVGQDGLYLPSFSENLSYMFNYQIGWMYMRYFLWNFSGRQNDTQGYGVSGGGSAILEGNWLTGLDFIDNQRLGDQSDLPINLKLNKGYNKYYMLPLILGLIGFFFQLKKHPKGWFTVFLLFILTGLAIVIYLNQKPAEPRERDYAYAASFYAFSIWIGLGVYALYDAVKNAKNWNSLLPVFGAGIGGSLFILLVQYLSDQSMATGLTLLYITGVITAVYALMTAIGLFAKSNQLQPIVPILLGLVVPALLAFDNWDDHDRSNRSTARDFAYNYLMSCDYNSILFTNGDNDTFPLWYIQEVEGVRTDVRVANMSLLSTDWHINQMKKKTYESSPLPITMNEYSYRSGKRDFVIIDENQAKRFKNNTLRKVKANQLAKINTSIEAIAPTLQNLNSKSAEQVGGLLKKLYLLENQLKVVQKEKNILSKKTLSRELTRSLNGITLNETQSEEINKITTQVNQIVSSNMTKDQPVYGNTVNGLMRKIQSLSKSCSDQLKNWPQKWYTAKEAIDFICDEAHKKDFYRYSCNQEYFIDFKNIYIPVDKKAAVENGIISLEQANSKQFRDTVKWRLKGGMLYKADLAVLDILANYKWDRAIYFASVVGMQGNEYLNKYMQGEGMTFKLTPLEFGGNGGINTSKMVDLMMDGYALKHPNDSIEKVNFLWGNMHEQGVLVDYYTMRMVQNIRLQLMKLTDALIKENKKEQAVAILDKTFEIMPIENNQVPVDDICFYLCANYFDAGDTAKGNALGRQLAALEVDKLKHYLKFKDRHFNQVWAEFGKSMNHLEMLREASISKDDNMSIQQFNYHYYNGNVEQAYNAISAAADNPENPTCFKNLGVLEDTEFKSVVVDVKQKFFDNFNERQKFFFNGQNFPVYYSFMWSGNRI
ncbi:MAG: hypothetical protein CL853_02800 [Crocinitomicaceae bacterium]|nr:hypothetical protein [Crocinitomicaceae bacterium]